LVFMIEDELNIKRGGLTQSKEQTNGVDTTGNRIKFDWEITPELKREGLSREIIRYVQAARKSAGLNVDDHIDLSLTTTDEDISLTIQEFGAVISTETLAGEISTGEYTHSEDVTIEGKTLHLSIQKN